MRLVFLEQRPNILAGGFRCLIFVDKFPFPNRYTYHSYLLNYFYLSIITLFSDEVQPTFEFNLHRLKGVKQGLWITI